MLIHQDLKLMTVKQKTQIPQILIHFYSSLCIPFSLVIRHWNKRFLKTTPNGIIIRFFILITTLFLLLAGCQKFCQAHPVISGSTAAAKVTRTIKDFCSFLEIYTISYYWPTQVNNEFLFLDSSPWIINFYGEGGDGSLESPMIALISTLNAFARTSHMASPSQGRSEQTTLTYVWTAHILF